MPEEQQELENQSQDNQNQNQEIQTTDTARIEQLIQASLGESERARLAAEQRSRELEDEVRSLRVNSNNQNQNSTPAEVDSNEFFQNPVKNISDLIARQNKPLLDFTAKLQRQDEYNTFKQQYKSVQGFDAVESIVDQLMAKKEISHANMQSAIFEAAGRVLLSQNNNNNNQNNNNQNNNSDNQDQNNNNNNNQNQNNNNQNQNQNRSAHIRPNNRQVSQDNQNTKPKRRELNEHEKRLCREQNMTEDRFFELLDAPIKVDDWKRKGGKK